MAELLTSSLELSADDVFSVSDLGEQIGRVLAADVILSDVAVSGEISNFKLHSSGHCYFSLKDERSQIRCCLWRKQAGRLSFRPADGDRVICFGQVEFYTPRGEISFVVSAMQFAGQGAAWEAFERIKNQLAGEGLFDEARKKPLPQMPRRIGVITSPTGAVIRDILHVLARRYPLATVVLIPAAVQGVSAPIDLMRALSFAEALDDLDVVIMARGGGSAEDLWCFNDEELCRAVAAFPVPLISAIGHETDFTILDFVADRRAPTPSAAAEIVAPDAIQLLGYLTHLKNRAASGVLGDVRLARTRLDYLLRSRALAQPGARVQEEREHIHELRRRAHEAINCRIQLETAKIEAMQNQLRALDPRRVLERGYALVSDASSGALITSRESVKLGQKLVVALADGEIEVVVHAR